LFPTNSPPGAVSGATSVRQGPDMAPPDGQIRTCCQNLNCDSPSGVPSMCDYSLHLVASRPAKVGDKLVATDFVKSITGGFAAVGEPDVAVCLLPGTELAFEENVQYQRAFSLFGGARVDHKVARFRQVNMHDSHVHHD